MQSRSRIWNPLLLVSSAAGGAFFADKMRVSKSVTMLDPLQTAYGRLMGVLLCVPAVCGEVFWTAAVMAALGDTANAIVEVDSRFFIVASAMVIFFYTSLGGLYSVTYTDILQISSTAICLWICVPFCLTHPVVGTIGAPERNWVGSIPASDYGQFLDLLLMTSLGGIPWQVYFQRVLGCDSDFTARMLSYISAIGCVFLAIPPIIIGAAAKSANFTAAGYLGPYRLRDKDRGSVLPLSIRYLTSGVVSMVGLIGITAAVMSSADSSMLSASSLVTRNIYQVVFRTTASDNEVAVMLRVLVCVIGSWATYIALQVESVLELWSLCSDVVYVLLFPQLLCALYFKSTNTYGSLMAFLLGALFRVLCGEPRVNLKAVIRLPMYDDKLGQRFPFRLTCMILSLITLLVGSYVAAKLFEKRWLKPRYDIFDCFRPERAAETKRDKIKPATLPQARRNLDSGKVKDEVSGSTTRDTGRSAKSASQDSGKVRDEVSGSVTRGAARSAKAASQDSGKVKDEVSGSVTRATARSAKAATQDSGKVKDEVSGSVTRATARSAKAATQDSGKVKNEVPGSVTRGTVGLAKAASQDSVKVKDEVSGPATRDTAGSAKTASSADGGAESESRIDVKSQVEAIAAASVVPQDGETEPEQATPVEKPPRRPSRRRPSPSGFHR
ncbi:high affinity choline transporter 1-like [Haemaphysalis longicornis]